MVNFDEVRFDIFYECYGIDDEGRTGCFRTCCKEDILRFAKRKNSSYILELKVIRSISCEDVLQLDFFDVL